MCFCLKEDIKLCYFCDDTFDYYKYLSCNKCNRMYHYKCAYRISKFLDKCIICDKIKFIINEDKYKNKYNYIYN